MPLREHDDGAWRFSTNFEKQEPRLRLRLVLPGRKCRWIDLFDGSSRPVTAGPIVPSAISSSLGLSEKLFIVDPRRASFLDDNFSIDDDGLNVRTAAVLDQSVDGIAYRPERVVLRSMMTMSALAPGASRPKSLRPRAVAPPIVAALNRSAARAPDAFLSTRREIKEA